MNTKSSNLSPRARGSRIGLVNLCFIALTSLAMLHGQTAITGMKQLKHDEDKGIHNALYKISDTRAILAYSGYKGFGYVRTFSIANDGTIAQLGELKFDDEDASEIAIEQVASDVYVIAYKGRSDDGFITTVKVSADGKTITQVKKVEHDTKQGRWNKLIKVDSGLTSWISLPPSQSSCKLIKVDSGLTSWITSWI